ncbi:MAG: DUF4340 domain-containing protein [Luteolibacter sp.]
MNKRQVIILCIVAIILAAAVAVMKFTGKETVQSTTARAAGETLFGKFPANEIASVAITGVDGTVTIEQKDGKWTVAERDGYPADTSAVNEFIRTLAELKVTRGMEAGPSFAPRFGMDENAAVAEERGFTAVFKDAAGKELATVSLGKNIESGASASPFGGAAAVGRYIRNHADESGFYAISEMFPSISDEASRWLDDAFFSPEKIKSVTLHRQGGEEAVWKVSRETEDAEFKLDGATGDETLNTTNAAPLKSLFSYARFNDVLRAAEIEARADAANKRSAMIETFDGFTYRLTITPAKPEESAGATVGEEMLLTVDVSAELPKERERGGNETPEDAKVKDESFQERQKALTEKLGKEKGLAGRTFLVAKSTVDALLKERADLVTKAEPAAENNANQGSVQNLPGGIVTTPPRSVATPPIEAVTPPIAIPPLEETEENKADQNSGKSGN